MKVHQKFFFFFFCVMLFFWGGGVRPLGDQSIWRELVSGKLTSLVASLLLCNLTRDYVFESVVIFYFLYTLIFVSIYIQYLLASRISVKFVHHKIINLAI